ncbi:RluA family pseudouridine synthase [Clostridium formicaceticum]|uniref:Pseudouridine synthase n=1 Tax=Clostridium formicaceticum TaxID=1497 RepID=A0AAC9RJ69_9CLOT|nr:RluA family pseudouridine synthase [Clostridium formicaceticum]AOY76621.1 RNA pseudouridine synthase [Clostridium formicaceticum]ARE87041.1 Ribosomal large subunit pseudouridine synthase D [Clostridium formicaceticum]
MIVEGEQREDTIVYEVEKKDDGESMKEVLKKRLQVSSRLLTKLKKKESIFLNNHYVKYHESVKQGDIIKISMVEEPSQFEKEAIPFSVIYEDVDVIIVNKQPGIVTHPTKSHPIGTIANAAQYYLSKKNIHSRIRFVNRLDMDTSGLLIIAKNPYAHHILSEQMQQDQVEKRYIAFIEGVMEKDFDTVIEPIYRPTFDSIKRVVDERGQKSITKYSVLERYKKATMIEVQLLTGRTHQIRVHMAHLGHPLIGDSLYGSSSSLIHRQALHASYLKFLQPRYREIVEIRGDLPEDLKQLQHQL